MTTHRATNPGTDELVYECPHCHSKVEVHQTQLNEAVDCPNPDCGRPFLVTPPEGRLFHSSVGVDDDGAVFKAHGQADGERNLVVSHPAMFRNHPLRYLGLMALLVGGISVASISWSSGMMTLSALGLAGAVCALLVFGGWCLQTYFETLTVTNRRTIYLKGIISRKTNEVQHDDVRNIQIDQNVLQRILGVGRLAISSSGQSNLEIDVRGIPNPEHIAETIRNYQ